MVTTNSACFHHYIPRPERHSGPFLHLKPLLSFTFGLFRLFTGPAVDVYAIIFIHFGGELKMLLRMLVICTARVQISDIRLHFDSWTVVVKVKKEMAFS